MRFDVDAKENEVAFTVSTKVYGREALLIAAQVLSSRAEAFLSEDKASYELTLKAKRKTDAAGLEALAGEFLNELLNQEYRFVVGRFNQKITSLVVTQALLAARGGEEAPKAPAGESDPAFQAAVAEMMSAAEEEIRRTMPKRIPPQGTPLPPPKQEDALA